MHLLKVLLGAVMVLAFARIVWLLHIRPSVGEIWESLSNKGVGYHRLRPDLVDATVSKQARLFCAQFLGPEMSVIYWRNIQDGNPWEMLKVLMTGKRERRLYFVKGHSTEIGGGPTPLNESDAEIAKRILQKIHEAMPS